MKKGSGQLGAGWGEVRHGGVPQGFVIMVE